MHPRIVLLLMLLGAAARAQSPVPAVPAPAQRYLDILVKRPQPGTLFERFYAAWLEEASAEELGQYLDSKARLPAATAADHLLLAIHHSHRGDDPAALSSYKAALEMNPSMAPAWIERSRIEARALDFSSALKSLDEALKAKPDAASSIEIGKLRGRALLRLGQNVAALLTWNNLATSHPDDEDLAEEVIDLLTDEGQYDSALDATQTLIKRTRDHVSKALRQLRLADIFLLAERRDEALKTLRVTLAATGSDTWIEGDVLGRISRVFRMGDDVDGLEKFFASLVKENPQRVTLAWQHTRLLAEYGQKDAALTQARSLLQSNPGRRDLQEGFLDLLESLDLIKEAVEQAQALSQQNTADKEILARLASFQHLAKDDAAAQSTLQRFLQAAGTGEADYVRVARLLESWEESPVQPGSPAALAYAAVVEKFPASIGAQEAQAHFLHRAGQRDAALAIWTGPAKSASLEDLLRISQALQARQESRTALDLLLPREKDFANEPRFFALLVQLGLANKELARTLPWARTRLRLAQDAEAIDTAVKDILLVLRSDEEAKLFPPLLKELQSSTTLTIQNRCLLATLLETAGKKADAEKALNDAAPEDKLVALSQLAQIFQIRKDWDKAAQTLQHVIELPGARNTARVQRMVDFFRRAEKPEQALTWIDEWKKLSPSAVQPWLDESRLLLTLNRTKDALNLLRTAMRKFPDNIELASSYATRCLENGMPDEAEQTYLSLYEKTTDANARLRLIGPLALAAQQHNTLPRLIENFQQRQKQNRASAQPWLALAEIYRATSNDEERRRCLYEASRLRPQDLALLLDIARSEEEIGLTTEALRTLESAAKLDKTSKTRESIARLQIESGDADLGYRMLFELAGGSQMDARGLEQMADAIAEKGEWDRVIAFLEPVLEKHPKDYRLHYLNAVALEEAGREKEAVRAFIEIMGMHEELPGVQGTGRSIGLRRGYGSMSLPPGTEDWLVLPNMVQAAYVHRQKMGGRGGYGSFNTSGGTATNGLLSNGFVQQAPGVTDSPVLALAHVLQMIATWDLPERDPVLRSLKRAGVNDAALLLAAAEASPQLAITPELLSENPQNTSLHAAWLLLTRKGDPEEVLPVYEHMFQLFEKTYPSLALRASAFAWRISGNQSPTWARRIIDTCQAMPKRGFAERQTLLSMLRSQSDLFPQQNANSSMLKLDAAQLRAIKDILKRWVRTSEDQNSSYINEEINAFAAVRDWEGVVEVIQYQLSLPEKSRAQAPSALNSPSTGRYSSSSAPFQPSPLPMPRTALGLPPEVLRWVAMLSQGHSSAEARLTAEQVTWQKEFQAGMRPFADKAEDPRLKFILRLMLGDEKALLDELAPRLAAMPSLDEHLFAGWLCQQLDQSDKALAHFQLAQVLATDPDMIHKLDLAMLFHTQKLQRKSGKTDFKNLTASVQLVLERLSQAASTPEEKFQLSRILNSMGLQEEALKMGQAARGVAASPVHANTATISNPYSSSFSYRQRQQKRVSVEDLIKKGDKPAAVREIVKQLRTAVQGCLNPQNSSSAHHHQLHTVIKVFEKHKLVDDVTQAMQAAAASGWRTQQEYAVFLEHTGLETKPAIEAHRAVISAYPRAYASHERLASLLAVEGDFPAALKHWQAMPAVSRALYLPALIQEFSQRNEISVPRPAALAGLLSAWLRSLPDDRPLPAGLAQQFNQALQNIQRSDSGQNLSFPALWTPVSKDLSRNGSRWTFHEDGSLKLSPESQKARDLRRTAHDELCMAMLRHPELAHMGFAPLAGFAMFENRRLDEIEKIALDLLSRHSMPKVRRLLMAQGYLLQNTAGDDLVSPFNSLFLTPERIAMPLPSVFATYSVTLRGDQRMLEEVVFPAILKAEGKGVADYCRAYAAVLTADDSHFVSAASAWLNPGGRTVRYSGQQQGGRMGEIIRLWQTRGIKAPLDQLFLDRAPKDVAVQYGYIPEDLKNYAFALGQRDPEAMRTFVRSLRDHWIGATAELRAQNITAWRESQQRRRSRVQVQVSPAQQTVQAYVQWLQTLLQDRRGLPLLTLIMEDDLGSSPEWLSEIASRYTWKSDSSSVEDFMQTAEAIGFFGDPTSFRVYVLGEEEKSVTWFGTLAWHYREHWNDETLSSALIQLGRSNTLGSHLMQALLLKNSRIPLQLDGKPVPIDATPSPRSAALHIVLKRHARDIAALSATGQSDLSALLRAELKGYPRPDQLGPELATILAPLISLENAALIRRADQVIAAKAWDELSRSGDLFIERFPLLLDSLARLDRARADAALHHTIELLRNSAEQRESVLQKHREPPLARLIQNLARVPHLLSTTFDLADKEGLMQSPSWTSNVTGHLEQLLQNPTQILLLLSATPWVADAQNYRDLHCENVNQPTLTARLITNIEHEGSLRPAFRTAVLSRLSQQPSTFGTDLLLAFLHRTPEESLLLNSFGNSRRPDDSAIRAFIQKRHSDFSKLRTDSASCLLALLKARIPDLEEKEKKDATLKQALQPLYTAEAAQFETDVSRWMQMTSSGDPNQEDSDAIRRCAPLLDRLAQTDKARAITLLDQISRLLAQQESQNYRGNPKKPPHDSQVGEWLKQAAHVPELFAEVMQRAEKSGAAQNDVWMDQAIEPIKFLSHFRGKPQRFLALLETAGMLDPAATFNPWPMPRALEKHEKIQANLPKHLHVTPDQQTFSTVPFTLLESWKHEMRDWHTLPSLAMELHKRQPRTFGRDLILLIISSYHGDPAAFARLYADEISACTIAQQELIAGCIQRLQWAEIFAANVPALSDKLTPAVNKMKTDRQGVSKKQAAKSHAFIVDLLFTKTWEEIEYLYYNTQQPAAQITPPNGMPLQSIPGIYRHPGQSDPAFDHLALQLHQLAFHNPDKAREGLRHVVSIYRSQFQTENGALLHQSQLDTLLKKVLASPPLAATAFRLADTIRPNGGKPAVPFREPWRKETLIDLALPAATLADAEKAVDTLSRMGFCVSAVEFDPVLLPNFNHDSFLEITVRKLSTLNAPLRQRVAQLLAQKKDAAFGSVLLAALIGVPDAGKNESLVRCSAQFAQVRKESAGAILHAFAITFPALQKIEHADQAVGDLACFAPLFQLRDAEEHGVQRN
ncbi:hypothetical protein [Prosthecobacter sp.]|uniref:hypothetical protein n=1 Tax=Prosthecobacter sp. TaxID=1965333 RepID=UPI0037836AE0